MDAHRSERIRRAAIWYARKHGPVHLAEDFGSYVVEVMLKLGLEGVNLRFARFNFIQELFGREGTYEEELSLEEPREGRHGQSTVTLGGSIAAEDPSPADFAQACRELKFEGGMDRLVFLLEFEYGFDCSELGHVLGLSRSRVNQLRREVDKQVKRIYGMSNKSRHAGRGKWAAREFLEWEAGQ